jgi:hypothetical protein
LSRESDNVGSLQRRNVVVYEDDLAPAVQTCENEPYIAFGTQIASSVGARLYECRCGSSSWKVWVAPRPRDFNDKGPRSTRFRY